MFTLSTFYRSKEWETLRSNLRLERTNNCGDVIESKHVHDFVTCSCGTVSCDGGLSYARRGFKNSPDDFTDMCEYEDVNKN